MSQHPHDPNRPNSPDLFDEIHVLITARSEGTATPEQSERLKTLLASDASARALYVRYIQETVALRKMSAAEVSGRVVGVQPSGCEEVGVQPLGCPSPTILASRETSTKQAKAWTPTFLRAVRERVMHPMAAVLLVGLIATAVIIYQFSTAPPQQPVAIQPPIPVPAEPAATLTSATDAHWLGEIPTQGEALPPGQRLVLERGSATVAFRSQARVVFEAPVQFEIVDQGACRLVSGKLTAHVPDPAKGFQVHTPNSTVTDLGTEFGVYVKIGIEDQPAVDEQEQPATSVPPPTPVTEVHVFRGQVELAQAPSEPSTLHHPPSTILSAGQAVTISDNKVEPLPAADPFKFAIDKLQGKPRTVLLSEDFESYDVGVKQNAIGAWIVQGSTRKGQSVGIADYDKAQAEWTAQHGLADPSLSPLPPSISRLLVFAPSNPNPRSEFPRVARPIEAPQLAHTCRVLMEFVIFPSGNVFEPSFALAGEAGLAPGIEFWRNADPAAPAIAWKANLVYRVRVLMDVAEGKLRGARVERSQWSGSAGWVRDADFRTPVPAVDWTTPPKFVIFGYPTVTPQTPATPYNIDNIRIEVIAEK